MGPKHPTITVKLVGEDGNAFAILGTCRQAMRQARLPQAEIDAFVAEATPVKGRVRAMVRECARRETWGQVEMLQEFQEQLLTVENAAREDALQVLDGLVEQAHVIKFAFEGMATNAATLAAFMEAEELPDGMERCRGAWQGGRRNRSASRWKWSIAVPADRLHVAELECRLDDLPTAIEPASEGARHAEG